MSKKANDRGGFPGWDAIAERLRRGDFAGIGPAQAASLLRMIAKHTAFAARVARVIDGGKERPAATPRKDR